MVDVVKLGIKRPVTRGLLPDPEPRETKYTFISVDDHLLEPPDTFEGRLPRKLQDRAPKVVETEEGHQVWQFEGKPAMLIDRLDNIMNRSGYGGGWPDGENSPSEVLRRNFWFCMIDDPSTIATRHAIGIENICFESDYPHGDGTWPDTQQVIDEILGPLPVEEIRKITHENAAALYRHPLPEVCVP